MRRLRASETLLGLCAVALLALTFASWWSVGEVGWFGDEGPVPAGPDLPVGLGVITSGDGDASAWQALAALDLVLLVTALAAGATVAFAARGTRGEAFRLVAAAAATLAAVSTAAVAVRAALAPPTLGLAPNVEVQTTAWGWAGLAACALLAAAGAATARAARRAAEPLG